MVRTISGVALCSKTSPRGMKICLKILMPNVHSPLSRIPCAIPRLTSPSPRASLDLQVLKTSEMKCNHQHRAAQATPSSCTRRTSVCILQTGENTYLPRTAWPQMQRAGTYGRHAFRIGLLETRASHACSPIRRWCTSVSTGRHRRYPSPLLGMLASVASRSASLVNSKPISARPMRSPDWR